MTADDIPYQLRPNKFIDRELFMEVLGLVVPSRGAASYIYISMGGRHLIDHTAAYRKLGITNLYSFDENEKTVQRQLFNRPIDSAKCDILHSGSLAGALDSIFNDFPEAKNLVIWLDYTNPHERLTQLQEIIEVAKRLQPGDVIRITMNANVGTLEEDGSTKWKEEGFPSPKEYRLNKLKLQLGSYVPTKLGGIGEDEFSAVLCSCIELAFAKAEEELGGTRLRPILLTTYKDGQRMVTATCLAIEEENATLPIGLAGWTFLPRGWTNLTAIEAPNLSLRERMRIDEYLSKKADEISNLIGFSLANTTHRSTQAIESYRLLHRYYPSFHNMDV